MCIAHSPIKPENAQKQRKKKKKEDIQTHAYNSKKYKISKLINKKLNQNQKNTENIVAVIVHNQRPCKQRNLRNSSYQPNKKEQNNNKTNHNGKNI